MLEHLNQVGQQNILAIIFLTIFFGLLLSARKNKLNMYEIVVMVGCLAYFIYAWNDIKVTEKIDDYQVPSRLLQQR